MNHPLRYRVNLTLTAELYDLVTRVARAQGKSRAEVVTELVAEVAPALERIVILSQLYQDASEAPKEGLRQALTSVEESLHQAMDVAGEQMDMLVDRHMRDTMRNGRQGKGTPPAAARAAVGAGRRGHTGKPRKRHQRAVKRSGRGKRGG